MEVLLRVAGIEWVEVVVRVCRHRIRRHVGPRVGRVAGVVVIVGLWNVAVLGCNGLCGGD